MGRDLCVCVGVQVDAQSITVTLLVVNLTATFARELHRWVSRREADSVDLPKDIIALKSRMDRYDARNSDAMSRINEKIGTLELDMREIKTVLHINHPEWNR